VHLLTRPYFDIKHSEITYGWFSKGFLVSFYFDIKYDTISLIEIWNKNVGNKLAAPWE
jgi:hypothetical protein